jgi:CRISPR-associated protein Cas1
MSFHVLHVLQHGALLSKDRGFIVCRGQDGTERRLPHTDIRAVVIAARGVTLTSHFVSSILETDGLVLHCNERYQPCGITVGLQRVVDLTAFLSQVSQPKKLNEKLWQRMLEGKTENQLGVLRKLGLESNYLEKSLKSGKIDEGNCARRYWKLYFPAIAADTARRDQDESTATNQMLNYGYAVLSALCHRSLLIHGLLPTLGVKHMPRYRSTPLVFDVMEPFRPMVDLMLADFQKAGGGDMKAWAKKIGSELRETRLRHSRYSVKLMDAIDISLSSLARSFAVRKPGEFWVPVLEG